MNPKLILTAAAMLMLVGCATDTAPVLDPVYKQGDTIVVGAICPSVAEATETFGYLQLGKTFPTRCSAPRLLSIVVEILDVAIDFEGDVMVLYIGRDPAGVVLPFGFISWPINHPVVNLPGADI